MASMTTEFFKVRLIKRAGKEELDYRLLGELLEGILAQHAVQNENYRSIDLSPKTEPDSADPKEVMDLFEDDKYLFGRLCRKKANNAVLKRNYETLEAENVFDGSEARKRGIEEFTFFILDCKQGIVSVVNTKGAPGIKVFSALCDNYSPEYDLEFDSIPNEDGIRVMYDSDMPEISRLEFDVPAPNAEFLQRVLGLNEEVIGDIIRENVYTASLIFKPVPYKKLVSRREKIQEILDILIRRRGQFSKAVVRGKSEKFSSRDFDLRAKYFTYPIEVKKTRTMNGKKVEYSLQEIVEQYKHGLHQAYEINYDIINAIANRNGSE